MQSGQGPISITALLAASNNQLQQGQNTHYLSQQALSPLPPKPQQSPRNISTHISSTNPSPNVQQSYSEQPIQYNYDQYNQVPIQSYQQSQYFYTQNQPYSQNEQQPVYQSPQIQPAISQLSNGYHILNHHNPALAQQQFQSVIIKQQILPPVNFQKQEIPQQQVQQRQPHETSRIYELTEEEVSNTRLPAKITPQAKTQIIAKPVGIDKGLSNLRQISNPNEYYVKCDDKLLSKIQEMETQITKLSRAIIKKDNQQLQQELSLNQIIEQKDRILQKKNRQLQASTRRIKLLIEQNQNKDLEIQRLKLQIQRTNRVNNISADMSKMDDFEIRNDTDYIKTSAYYKDLVSESQPHRNHMVPTREVGHNRVVQIQEGMISPAQIDLRYAKPAGEITAYQLSGNRQQRNNYY